MRLERGEGPRSARCQDLRASEDVGAPPRGESLTPWAVPGHYTQRFETTSPGLSPKFDFSTFI